MNRRQFLTHGAMVGAAVALAPVTALAFQPKPLIFGERRVGGIVTYHDMTELSKLQICRIFQVPPHMVGLCASSSKP